MALVENMNVTLSDKEVACCSQNRLPCINKNVKKRVYKLHPVSMYERIVEYGRGKRNVFGLYKMDEWMNIGDSLGRYVFIGKYIST